MEVLLKIRDTELYYSKRSSLGDIHWSASRELAKKFNIENLSEPKFEMLNRFLIEFFGEVWTSQNSVSKSEYIEKFKSRVDPELVHIIVECYHDKNKLEFEKA